MWGSRAWIFLSLCAWHTLVRSFLFQRQICGVLPLEAIQLICVRSKSWLVSVCHIQTFKRKSSCMKVTLQSTGVYSLGVWHFLLVYKQTRKQRESFRSCLVCWVTFPGRYGEVLKHRDLPRSTRMTSVSAVQQPCQKELCLGKRGLLQYNAGKACPCLHSTSSCAGCGD